MSVIMDANMGDKIYVVEEFHVSKYKEIFSWKTAKNFKIGDKVKFCSFFMDEYNKNPKLSGMPLVLFEDHNGNLYNSFASHFMTKEGYNNIYKHVEKDLKLK